MFKAKCGSCGQVLQLGEKHIDKSVRCPTCQDVIKIQKAVSKSKNGTASAREQKTSEAKQVVTCPGCVSKIAVSLEIEDTVFQCPFCRRKMRLAASDSTGAQIPKRQSKDSWLSLSDVIMTVDSSPTPDNKKRRPNG
jgi:DNA-directed RNA polymerase subunit M/transcription elongation factor TFIIS